MTAALSYLGFGPPPPSPDWGAMISENQIGLQVKPWVVLLPVITIAVLTIGTNLIAEGVAAASARRTGTGPTGSVDHAGAIDAELVLVEPPGTVESPGPVPAGTSQRTDLEQV